MFSLALFSLSRMQVAITNVGEGHIMKHTEEAFF